MTTPVKIRAFAVAAALCVHGCGIKSGSLMEDADLSVFGDGDKKENLEIPPDLDPPETKDTYSVASMRESAAPAVRVLPPRLGMRLHAGDTASRLAVSATPDALWPHLVSFWADNGFEIVDESARRGFIETNWREQTLNAGVAADLRVRDKFRMRVERASDAATEVYLANRKATFGGGEWRLVFGDRETEVEILYDLSDYLASLREVKRIDLPPLEDVRFELDIKDLAGAPALTVGRPYARTWRGIGAALDKAGLGVQRADRSRGVYLVRYDDAENAADEARLLQVRLLARGRKTVVTVHPNRERDAALAYESAHAVLSRIVRAYKARA